MAILLRRRQVNEDLLADAERSVAAARRAADAAAREAAVAEAASDGRRGVTFGPGAPAKESVRRSVELAAESAAAASRAAFLLDLNLKLARSTNTFRLWQQVPAWLLAGAGVGLAFLLGGRDSDNPGGWVSVVVMLVLAVVASFRGPADVRIGSGPRGDETTPEREVTAGDESGPGDRAGETKPAAPATPSRPAAAPALHPGGSADGVRILGTGLDFATRKPLLPAVLRREFAERVYAGLTERSEELNRVARETRYGSRLRGERERKRTPDLGDPRAVGWTFLVAEGDERSAELAEALRPLAEQRGMNDPGTPLLFDAAMPWSDWLTKYQALGDERPYYVLVVGGPDRVPFHFQSLLDSTASVGRVDFDSVDDLGAYVEKLLRLESTSEPTTAPEAFFFAPDAGLDDATFFSRRYLAEPLAAKAKLADVSVSALYGDDATKANLVERLRASRAALVYTASHGLGAPTEPLDVQKQINGAMCCQDDGDDWLFAAADVPPNDEPFLEGAVFFQFACYGYGTPAESDFMHWLGEPTLNAEADFVAALPKRLLAHPRGPIAFVGHTDTAWLHGFDDPDNPLILQPYHERLTPFSTALQVLLTTQPAGLALSDLNKRFDLMNGYLANELDRMQRQKLDLSEELVTQLADTFIFRTDAQNYMVFGDPAARIRMSD